MSDSFNPDYVCDSFDNLDNDKFFDPAVSVSDSIEKRFQICFDHCTVEKGQVLEFGVFQGSTLNIINNLFEGTVYGFDSWEGLPEDDPDVPAGGGGFHKGSFKTNKIEVKEGIVLVDGWFKDTLPKFVEQNSSPIKFIHVDSDNYNSAKDVFDNLGHLIVPGTVIKFDEYRYYNGWRFREYRAFKEFIKTTSFDYDYIVRSSNNEKAALRIK